MDTYDAVKTVIAKYDEITAVSEAFDAVEPSKGYGNGVNIYSFQAGVVEGANTQGTLTYEEDGEEVTVDVELTETSNGGHRLIVEGGDFSDVQKALEKDDNGPPISP